MAEPGNIQALVEGAKRGDRAALEAIVELYQERLKAALRGPVEGYRRIHLEVDEVVQETFLQAFQAFDRFRWRGDDSLFPWLYGIARNVLMKLAGQAGRTRTLEIPERIPASAASPSKAARREERFERLEDCLAKLKPEYREVLRLARLEGLTARQIAGRMNRTEYAVKHLMARAIRELREAFGDTESLHLPPRSLEADGGGHGQE